MSEEIVKEGIKRAQKHARPEWELNTDLLRETVEFAQSDVGALDYQWFREAGRTFAIDITFNGSTYLVDVKTENHPPGIDDASVEVDSLDTAFETATALMATIDATLQP